MTIFSEFGTSGGRLPMVNAQAFAWEQLVSVQSVTSDLRGAMFELVWRSITAMCSLAQGQFVAWVRRHRAPRQDAGHGRHCCC